MPDLTEPDRRIIFEALTLLAGAGTNDPNRVRKLVAEFSPPRHTSNVDVRFHDFGVNLSFTQFDDKLGDDGEDGVVFTVPKLIADMLAWYSGEEAGFWAEDTELIDEDRGGVRDYSELAIWLDPQSIRNHFECCDPNPVDGVSDELLAEVAADFLEFTGTWHRISDIFNEIETMVEERKTA